MADITGVGAAVFDILVAMREPLVIDEKTSAESIQFCGGGPCATALVAARKLGASSAFVGALGDSQQGWFLLKDFERYGVDVSGIKTINGADCIISLVLVDKAGGTRTCLVQRERLPAWQLDDSQKQAIRDSRLLMVDGNEMDRAVEAAKLAREHGADVLYDAGSVYKDVDRLLPYANILIPSRTFAMDYTGCREPLEALDRLYKKFRPDMLVITLGAQGGVYRDAGGTGRYSAYPVDIVDSNGSGDVFHAAFAVARLKGWNIERCCKYASAAAALKCIKLGSRAAAPTAAELDVFLAKNGIDL